MRKAIIAAIVASALFAVGAFAAQITNVNTDDVASGAAEVKACADTAEVAYTTDGAIVDDGPLGGVDFVVTDVTVRFRNDDASPTRCVGALVDIAISSGGVWYDGTCTIAAAGAPASPSTTCTMDTDPPVEGIDTVRVLANGNAITNLDGPAV